MALAKNSQPLAKAAVQASIAFQAPAPAAAPAKKAPAAKKAARQPRVERFDGEPLAVESWATALPFDGPDPMLIGIDLYSGRLIAYGTYAEITEIYHDQALYEKLCLNCGKADDADTYMRLHEGVLRMMAIKLGVVNAHTRPRDELASACAIDVGANGWLPSLDADLALDLEDLRLQPDPSTAMLPTSVQHTDSSVKPNSNKENATMALAKGKTADAAPKETKKGAAKPPAAKPAAAKAADKPATPKPAAAKPATPKPAAAKPAGKPAAEPKAKAPRAEAVEQNGIKQPLDMTGKCGRVWVACDKKLKELKGKPTFTSADVVGMLPDENPGNVRLEVSRWAKFHGHSLPRAPRAGKAE